MNITPYCISCLVQRQEERIRKYPDENKKLKFMKEVLNLIGNSKEDVSAPFLIGEIGEIHRKVFGDTDSYTDLKREYNQFMLNKESELKQVINKSSDSFLTALKLARAGNYIDFGAMNEISNEKLNDLLGSAEKETINQDEYENFCQELSSAKTVVYITDNCGEIVIDKLFIMTIKEKYPDINIKVIVRGSDVLNDATIEDAIEVGLTEIASVLGNGTKIPGTVLTDINIKAKKAIYEADLIVSKGQANFETLYGSGLNIYYMFLCKCDLFVKRFNMELYKGIFANEKNIKLLY
ncbi:MAG: hypothetical protein K0S41_1055 [Anaerocolumna sp.]|jgi:uncharacterized protein with ATP-grasp and redox domains|nr:hypothetical protein [Anaerocolumna sp.]